MRFSMRERASHEDPDINLIPMIDLFLVIIIFLMQTTTYDRFSELQITLPQGGQAAETAPATKNREIYVGVASTGAYKIDGERLNAGAPIDRLTELLHSAAQRRSTLNQPLIVVINADAQATHQSVVNIMEAAHKAEISNITFSTQSVAPSKDARSE